MKDLHLILTGPPGSGKSRVIQVIKELLEKEGIKTKSTFKQFDKAIVYFDYCLKISPEEAAKIVTRI